MIMMWWCDDDDDDDDDVDDDDGDGDDDDDDDVDDDDDDDQDQDQDQDQDHDHDDDHDDCKCGATSGLGRRCFKCLHSSASRSPTCPSLATEASVAQFYADAATIVQKHLHPEAILAPLLKKRLPLLAFWLTCS